MSKAFCIFFMVEIVVITAQENCKSKLAQLNVSFLSNCLMENSVYNISFKNNSDILQCLCQKNRTCVKNGLFGKNGSRSIPHNLTCDEEIKSNDNITRNTMMLTECRLITRNHACYREIKSIYAIISNILSTVMHGGQSRDIYILVEEHKCSPKALISAYLNCNGTREKMSYFYAEIVPQDVKDSSTNTTHPTENNSNKTQNRHSVIVMAVFVGACGLIILFCFIVFGLKPNARKETSDNRNNARNNRNTQSGNIKQDCCYEEPDKTDIQSSSHKVRLHSQAASGLEDTAGYLRPVWNPKVACSQHYSSVEIKDVKEDSNYPTGQPEHTVKRNNHTKLMDTLHSKSRKIVQPKETNVYDEAEQVLQEKESTVADENLQASETMAKPPEELYHYPGEIIFVKKD